MKIELKYYAPSTHHSAWIVDDRYTVYWCPFDSACDAVCDSDEKVTDAKLATKLLLEVAKHSAEHPEIITNFVRSL
jgi:hypothetical protein